MKRIAEFKKLYQISGEIDLKELKSAYRTAMKECHPDKFPNSEDALEAENKSKKMIEAYHFLVSIAPETIANNKSEYLETMTKSNIHDFVYKNIKLEVTFLDGSVYEYFGVPKNVYQKFVNSDTPFRFAKRHIFDSYLYRNVKKRDESENSSS